MLRRQRLLQSNNSGSGRSPFSFSAPLMTTIAAAVALGLGTPTFTRATTAYVQDWENLFKPVLAGETRFMGARRVANLTVAPSEDFSNAAWLKGSITVTGTQNISWIAAATASITTPTLTSYATGDVIRITAKVRSNTGGNQKFALQLDNGTFLSGDLTATPTDQIFSFSATATGGLKRNGIFRASDLSAADLIVSWVQVEVTTGQSNQNPSEYVSVGVLAAPHHGANVDGVKYFNTKNGNTVAANVVTEATGAAITPANGASVATTDAGGPFGYKWDFTSTNLLLWSNDLTNAAWVKTTMTAAMTSTGPGGVPNSATRVTATGANALCVQTIVAAASSRTSSFWVKRITGTGNFDLTQDSVGFTTRATTAGWTKVKLTASQLDATVGFRIATSGDAFDIWCGLFEAGDTSTSPIPTTTVAVTRNGDSLLYPTAGNANGLIGAAYAEFTTESPSTNQTGVLIAYNGAGGQFIEIHANALHLYDDSAYRDFSAVAMPVTSPAKVATTWGGATSAGAVNSTVTSGIAFDGDMNLAASIGVGMFNTANPADQRNGSGTARNIRLYTAKQSDAQLAAMTT